MNPDPNQPSTSSEPVVPAPSMSGPAQPSASSSPVPPVSSPSMSEPSTASSEVSTPSPMSMPAPKKGTSKVFIYVAGAVLLALVVVAVVYFVMYYR